MDADDRSLVFWALPSLMVAEERITTKFSGLVGAYETEEEATFLATQQVDKAPADRVHPEVVEAMRELGVDLADLIAELDRA
jgi:hypothetical protein